MSKIVTVLNSTQSKKVGDVAVTYAPIQSCPKSCRFLDNGCYAQQGHCGFTFRRLSNAVNSLKDSRPKNIALAELEGILALSGDKPLRLHISGDCRTPEAAKILAFGAAKYKEKHNQPVWTYTHAWKDIPRKAWGNISVFASCETMKEVQLANNRGYAVCMTRYKPFDKGFFYNNDPEGYWMLPCKEQVSGITCSNCHYCFKDEYHLQNKNILCFFSHGTQKNKINNILKSL